MSHSIIQFEIHGSDPEKLIPFFEQLFGWRFTRWPGVDYWMIELNAERNPGINGGMIRRMGAAPAANAPVSAFVCTVQVASVDDALAHAVSLGGEVALPKMAIPGVGWLGYIKDPDGNVLGVITPDANAG